MNCQFHPDREAIVRCLGCQAPLCKECIAELSERTYCPQCVLSLAAEAVKREPTLRPAPEAEPAPPSKAEEPSKRRPLLSHLAPAALLAVLLLIAAGLVVVGFRGVFSGGSEGEVTRRSISTPQRILSNLYPGWTFKPVEASDSGERLLYEAGPTESGPMVLRISFERRNGRWAIGQQEGIPADKIEPPKPVGPPQGDPCEVVKKDERYSRGESYRVLEKRDDGATVLVYNSKAYPQTVQVYLAPKAGQWAVYDDNLNMWRPGKK